MNYDLASLRQRVIIDKLDDEDFEPEIVDRFLNDTLREIYNEFELPYQEKIFSGKVPVGSNMFALPDDVAVIQNAVITGPDGQQRNIHNHFLNFRDFTTKFPTASGSPAGSVQFWTMYSGNMILSRPTDEEYTLELYYIKKPTLLVDDTDTPEFPEEFSEMLVLGAFKRVQEREGDYDEAAVTLSQYNAMMSQLVARYGYRRKDGPITMRLPRHRGR